MNHIEVLIENLKTESLIELYLLSSLIVLNEPNNKEWIEFISALEQLTDEDKHFLDRDKYLDKYLEIEKSLKTYRPFDLLMKFNLLIYYFISNPTLDSFNLTLDYPSLKKWADKYLYLARGKQVF